MACVSKMFHFHANVLVSVISIHVLVGKNMSLYLVSELVNPLMTKKCKNLSAVVDTVLVSVVAY